MTSTSSNQALRRVAIVTGALALAGGAAAVAMTASARAERYDAEQYACATAAALQAGQGAGAGEGRQEPGDARRDAEGRRPRAGAMPPFDFGWGAYGRGGLADLRQPRPHEWAEAQAFMARHSPRRQAALDELPEGERKEGLKRYVYARYRSLLNLQKRDRPSYEQRVAQLGVEDQIFAIVSDSAADPASLDGLREKLRPQVGRLVELDAEGRRRRIDWLKKELSRETDELDRLEKDLDTQVERRISTYAQWADRWAARKRKAQADKQQDAAPEPGRKAE